MQMYTHVDLTSIFGVQYSSPGSPCGCSMRASRFSQLRFNVRREAAAASALALVLVLALPLAPMAK